MRGWIITGSCAAFCLLLNGTIGAQGLRVASANPYTGASLAGKRLQNPYSVALVQPPSSSNPYGATKSPRLAVAADYSAGNAFMAAARPAATAVNPFSGQKIAAPSGPKNAFVASDSEMPVRTNPYLPQSGNLVKKPAAISMSSNPYVGSQGPPPSNPYTGRPAPLAAKTNPYTNQTLAAD